MADESTLSALGRVAQNQGAASRECHEKQKAEQARRQPVIAAWGRLWKPWDSRVDDPATFDAWLQDRAQRFADFGNAASAAGYADNVLALEGDKFAEQIAVQVEPLAAQIAVGLLQAALPGDAETLLAELRKLPMPGGFNLYWIGPFNDDIPLGIFDPEAAKLQVQARGNAAAEPIARAMAPHEATLREQTGREVEAAADRPAEQASGEREGEKSEADGRNAKLQLLQPAERKAYFAYLSAEAGADRQMEDREAFDWLRENGLPDDAGNLGELTDYKLPAAFATWSRQLRAARNALGEQKYTRRPGRPTGSSIVRPREI